MKNRIIAMITATALAVSGAGQASADEDLALKLALGALGAGILAQQIDRNRDPAPLPVDGIWGNDDWRWQETPTWQSGKHRRKTIPGACVFDARVHGDWREFVAPGCLEDFGLRANLPRSCKEMVRTNRGRINAFDLPCLEHKGYRVRWSRW